ncbi:MAG: hypothetical protein J5964_05670 [Eubacterium sp.]|nr:hypothetical protein [Eubacterium sp.]
MTKRDKKKPINGANIRKLINYVKSFDLKTKVGFIYCTLISVFTIIMNSAIILYYFFQDYGRIHFNEVVSFYNSISETSWFLTLTTPTIFEIMVPIFSVISIVLSVLNIIITLRGFIKRCYENYLLKIVLINTLNPALLIVAGMAIFMKFFFIM